MSCGATKRTKHSCCSEYVRRWINNTSRIVFGRSMYATDRAIPFSYIYPHLRRQIRSIFVNLPC